jgi:ribosomal protein S27AE
MTTAALSGNYGGYNGFVNPYDETGYGQQNANAGKGAQTRNDSEITDAERKRRFDTFSSSVTGKKGLNGEVECKTCENRRYQDQSNDSGVSMQSPTKVDPRAAESAVRAHELQHVSRNAAKAKREGKEIVSQSVVIKRTICPECGRSVIAGGETRTVTKESNDPKPTDGALKPNGSDTSVNAPGKPTGFKGIDPLDNSKRSDGYNAVYGKQIPASVNRQSPYGAGLFGDSKGGLFDKVA